MKSDYYDDFRLNIMFLLLINWRLRFAITGCSRPEYRVIKF